MIFIDCIYFFNFYRNVGPFRKRLPEYNEDNIEMNNSIDCPIPVYHDTVLNTDNGSVPKNPIRNNTAVNTATGEVRQNKTYFSNYEYAVVVKKHPAGLAAQSSEFDLEEGDNQSQRFETEDEYDSLKHTVDKGEDKDQGEGQLENNVYDSSLGVCDGVDPTYNSIKIGPVNNDTTYDHTSNIIQKQINSDTTYDRKSNIVQNQVNNDTTYDHTSNIVQKQVNNDTTYDRKPNIVQNQVSSDTTYHHTSNIIQQ